MNFTKLETQFQDIFDRTAHIEAGGTIEIEHRALFALAQMVQNVPGDCMEIGASYGKSSAYIAEACRLTNRPMLYCIDTWAPYVDWNGQHVQRHIAKFQDNMRSVDLVAWTTAIRGDSLEWAAKWNSPLRFLFVDGRHEYEYAKSDILKFGGHIGARGIIACHDYALVDGVTRAIEEASVLMGRSIFTIGLLAILALPEQEQDVQEIIKWAEG